MKKEQNMKNYKKIPSSYWKGFYQDLNEERESYKYFKELDKAKELKTIEAIVKNSQSYVYVY